MEQWIVKIGFNSPTFGDLWLEKDFPTEQDCKTWIAENTFFLRQPNTLGLVVVTLPQKHIFLQCADVKEECLVKAISIKTFVSPYSE